MVVCLVFLHSHVYLMFVIGVDLSNWWRSYRQLTFPPRYFGKVLVGYTLTNFLCYGEEGAIEVALICTRSLSQQLLCAYLSYSVDEVLFHEYDPILFCHEPTYLMTTNIGCIIEHLYMNFLFII